MPQIVLPSAQDSSVNWVIDTADGPLEARYVRRRPEAAICYLSSQTGCKQACRMCHLTQTGQTRDRPATLAEFEHQARQVLAHLATQEQAQRLHYNFMARGEALANPLMHGPSVLAMLHDLAAQAELFAEMKISTIMPKVSAGLDLARAWAPYCPDVYYSMYSADEAVRRRWLPKAQPLTTALPALARYQADTRKIVVVHHALISGVNDAVSDALACADALDAAGLICDVNIVRYNPPSEKQGQEATDERVEAYAQAFATRIAGRVKVVPRVGFDVFASCGMFVS